MWYYLLLQDIASYFQKSWEPQSDFQSVQVLLAWSSNSLGRVGNGVLNNIKIILFMEM